MENPEELRPGDLLLPGQSRVRRSVPKYERDTCRAFLKALTKQPGFREARGAVQAVVPGALRVTTILRIGLRIADPSGGMVLVAGAASGSLAPIEPTRLAFDADYFHSMAVGLASPVCAPAEPSARHLLWTALALLWPVEVERGLLRELAAAAPVVAGYYVTAPGLELGADPGTPDEVVEREGVAFLKSLRGKGSRPPFAGRWNPPGQRPKDGRWGSATVFESAVLRAMKAEIRRGHAPTEEAVARWFEDHPDPEYPSRSSRRLREDLAHYGLRWDDLTAEAYRQLEAGRR